MLKLYIISFSFLLMLIGCVSSKKFNKMQEIARLKFDSVSGSNRALQSKLDNCTNNYEAALNEKKLMQGQLDNINKQATVYKQNNTTMLKQLEDLSVVTSKQAESIRQSMENIGAKDLYIQDLQREMARKDSLNMALVMNLKGAIGDINDKDINIKVDKGVVFVDISDKMLFASGSYDIKPKAQEVLGKVALVLNNQPNIEFAVEGHTDNVKYHKGVLLDNWDLSVKRATAVVRVLQVKYGLDPTRIIAAGRSEYAPIDTNDTPEGRAVNRRTRIVILPQLDQFFKLLETK